MKFSDNILVSTVLLGAAFLAGLIVAAMTVLPGLSVLNEGLDCPIHPCNADLLAQRSMALAAWIMVAVTAVSVAIGGASLILIALTLKAAQASAKAAADTATAAIDTLEVSEQGYDFNQKITKLQTRSYLTVSDMTCAEHEDGIEIVVAVRNSGVTPAFYVRVEGEFDVYGTDIPLKQRAMRPVNEVASGREGTASFRFKLSNRSMLPGVRDFGISHIEVSGTIRYYEVFGKHREQNFSYRIEPVFVRNRVMGTAQTYISKRNFYEKTSIPDFFNDCDEIDAGI
jgi:hypothetical protein